MGSPLTTKSPMVWSSLRWFTRKFRCEHWNRLCRLKCGERWTRGVQWRRGVPTIYRGLPEWPTAFPVSGQRCPSNRRGRGGHVTAKSVDFIWGAFRIQLGITREELVWSHRWRDRNLHTFNSASFSARAVQPLYGRMDIVHSEELYSNWYPGHFRLTQLEWTQSNYTRRE